MQGVSGSNPLGSIQFSVTAGLLSSAVFYAWPVQALKGPFRMQAYGLPGHPRTGQEWGYKRGLHTEVHTESGQVREQVRY